MSKCTTDCVMPSLGANQCHCKTCHRSFGGLALFDEHRKHGECLDPATLHDGQCAQDERGFWRWYRPVEGRAVPGYRQYHPARPDQTTPQPSGSPGGTRA